MTAHIRWLRRAATWLILTFITFNWVNAMATTTVQSPTPKRVTLVGASIGKDWNFDRIGERLKVSGYEFQYVGKNDFDKGTLIDELVRRNHRPDVVLIKECSTYFPGDEERYRKAVIQWVDRLRSAGIEPVLVTAAPVAEPIDTMARVKNRIKRIIGKPTWLDSITHYNDWIKDYGNKQGLAVFDLEARLRRSDQERWLKAEYNAGDAVHLNAAGYRAMDRAFAEFLDSWNRKTARR